MWEHQRLPIRGDDADESVSTKWSSTEAELLLELVLGIHRAINLAHLVNDSAWVPVHACGGVRVLLCTLVHRNTKWQKNRNEKLRTIAQLAVCAITGM